MAKKGSSAAPPAPNPAATAAAQGQANKEAAIATARLGQYEEVTPFGNLRYEPTGQTADGIDQYRRIIELDPSSQQQLDLSNLISTGLLNVGADQLGRVGESLGTSFDMSGLPEAPTADPAERQRIEDAVFGRITDRLDPQFARDEERLRTSLANKGFAMGAEGYRNDIEDFRRSKGDVYSAAAQDAVRLGGDEMARLFNLRRTGRADALSEALLERGLPLQEAQALVGAAPGIVTPQFSPAPQPGIAPADITSPTMLSHQAALNQYNRGQSSQNSMWNSILNLGGTLGSSAILAKSDKNVKTDIAEIDEDKALEGVKKLPIKAWRYKDGSERHVGPMAQDYSAEFGGPDKMIDLVSSNGISFAAIKALAKKVDKLETSHAT